MDGVDGLGSCREASSYDNGFCLPRITYMAVIKPANAITTAVMAIASGDQNPLLLTVTGLSVEGKPVDVPVPVLADVPVGIPVDVGVVGGAWVTVNVALATPPPRLSVAVTVYVPGDAGGTVNTMLALGYE